MINRNRMKHKKEIDAEINFRIVFDTLEEKYFCGFDHDGTSYYSLASKYPKNAIENGLRRALFIVCNKSK